MQKQEKYCTKKGYDMKDSIMILVGVVMLIAFLTLVSEGIKMARASAETEENKSKRYIYFHVLDLAETIVKSLNQTIVEPLKESEELTFDKAAQIEVLEKAKARVKNNLDDKSKELLAEYLGSSVKIDGFIEDVVEAKVNEAKKK